MTTTRAKINSVNLNSPVSAIIGIGPKKAEAFAKLGVFTVEDLFFLMPRRYEDRRFPKPLAALESGTNECAIAFVSELSVINGRTEAIISDSSGTARVVWFTDKIAKFLHTGMRIALYGQVNDYYNLPQFVHPEFEILRRRNQSPFLIGKIFPVYPGTADLSQKEIKKIIETTIGLYSDRCLKEFLPKKILKQYGMLRLREAVTQIHAPADEKKFIRARSRLAFDELFLLQTGIMMRRMTDSGTHNALIVKAGKNFDAFMKNLPFKITNAQSVAISEILNDMEKDFPMNRLLQGDVGSGKTLVAAAAMLAVADSGAQTAFMAPTEILAQQHYLKLKKNLEPLGLNVALLTGSLREKERRKILMGIFAGSVNIIIGTHAIFTDDVDFYNLALVIVDEQHRFGVLQRNKLISKGKSPHVLTMTATPIPRTLILSVYGDLEVSVLNEMPAGRKKIKTISLNPREFKKIPKMIREQIKKGGQIYWVCPLIEESERDLSAVKSTFEKLRELMPELKIAMLHGNLTIDEKSEIMQNFSSGIIDLLVATVIIEVGVDVPNATMIIIQDAGQFGLAQLHQLRGRVGRGKAQSFCVLLENENLTPEGRERILAMVETSDGFKLAEADLIQRGPGEICGTHQHGVTDFRVADLVRDEKILTVAREEAKNLLSEDPDLNSEPLLKNEIIRRLGTVLELAATS